MKEQKVALVTGGTRGIGEAISVGLKEAGFKVAATYQRNVEKAKAFEARTGIKTYQWNVANLDECEQGITRLKEDMGSVDILVNNAGITRDKMFHKMTWEQWSEVIKTNLDCCFNMTKVVIDDMRQNRWGRIINISSINAQKGQMGQTNYAASKAGIIGFTRSLAQEVASKGITVNAITPGYIETDMVRDVPKEVLDHIVGNIPVGRLGQPEEISQAVLFLSGPHSGFMTGSTLSLNGGQYMG